MSLDLEVRSRIGLLVGCQMLESRRVEFRVLDIPHSIFNFTVSQLIGIRCSEASPSTREIKMFCSRDLR